jgi:exodeoxyribonuclease VIII
MLFPSDKLDNTERKMATKDLNESRVIKENDEWYYGDQTLVTNSHLKVLLESGPEGLAHYFENGSEDNAAFAFGRALHCLILEPEEFTNRYYIFDDREICKQIGGARPTSTNKYKEWKEQLSMDNLGKEMISLYDMNTMEAMEAKLYSIPQVKSLLEDTAREIIYRNELLGVPVKCKIDAIKPNRAIIDLKTTSDAPTPYNMAKRIRNFGYDRQMAFYADIADVESAFIIAVQKTAPYTVGVYEISRETLAEGKEKYEFALNMYKELYRGNLELDKFYYQGSL